MASVEEHQENQGPHEDPTEEDYPSQGYAWYVVGILMIVYVFSFIDRQILAAWLDIQGYTLPKDKEATWVRLLNEHISQIASESGGRYGGLAAVPLRDGELAARELE